MAKGKGWLLALVAVFFGAIMSDKEKEPDKDGDQGGREPEGGEDPDPKDEPEENDVTPERIVDLQDVSPPEKRKGSREPWAVVLHQMGFSRGNDPLKYKKVTAQYIITPDGTIAQLHPLTTYLYSSHGFNEGGIAIEFAGNLPSRTQSDEPAHYYKPDKFGRDQLTVEQVYAGRWLLEYLRDFALPSLDLELRVVLAHRQASALRGNDPGPDVWANVGQWAVDEMGLSDGGVDFYVSDGKPIRDDWREAPTLV